MANIDNNLVSDLESLGWSVRFFNCYIDITESDLTKADEMLVFKYVSNEQVNIKLPKSKLVSLEWVMGKVNKDKVFFGFCDTFKSILKGLGFGLESISVYPASYGIGVFVNCGFRNNIKSTISKLEIGLNSLKLDYKTEYSEGGWVFRFVISKSKENIARIVDCGELNKI